MIKFEEILENKDLIIKLVKEKELDKKPYILFNKRVELNSKTDNDFIESCLQNLGSLVKEKIIKCPENLVIPDFINKIKFQAFSGCKNLISVIIPNSITKIEEYAFYGTGLKSIKIPNSITSIENCVFNSCFNLTSIDIPDNIISIENSAFNNCINLKSIKIPNSVKVIERQAFYNCSSLTSIIIPQLITEIDDYTFYGCSSLTSINISKLITKIGERAFQDCSSLTSINVDKDNPYYTSIDGVLYNKDLTELIKYPEGKISTTFNIPDSVVKIEKSAFSNCINLNSVIIPNSVKYIGEFAFNNCTKLTSINIPTLVTKIEQSVFNNCYNLSSINIPNSVTYIRNRSFYNCSNLTSINIPDSVTEIGNEVFSGCKKLIYVNISNSVIHIGYGSFSGCENLEKINVEKDNLNFSSIDGVLYWNILKDGINYHKDEVVLRECPESKKLITIPEYVTVISSEAFWNCKNLTSVTIPNSVTYIDSGSFYGCEKLKEINVDENNPNYSSLDGVLYNKDKIILIKCLLTKNDINIPNSVTEIKDGAFDNCSNLREINVDSDNTNYTSIDGILYDKDIKTLIRCPEGKFCINNIPKSVTIIGKGAFKGVKDLISITILDSVKEIGFNSFANCESLVYIRISKDCKIEEKVFDNCNKDLKIIRY